MFESFGVRATTLAAPVECETKEYRRWRRHWRTRLAYLLLDLANRICPPKPEDK